MLLSRRPSAVRHVTRAGVLPCFPAPLFLLTFLSIPACLLDPSPQSRLLLTCLAFHTSPAILKKKKIRYIKDTGHC